MTHIIPILFAYPAILLMQKLAQKSLRIAIITLLLTTTFLFKASFYPNEEAKPTVNTLETNISNQDKLADTVYLVKKGDTLSTILYNQHVNPIDAKNIIAHAQRLQLISKLQIGQKITFDFSSKEVKSENDDKTHIFTLEKMTLDLNQIDSIVFTKTNDKFEVTQHSIPLKKIVTKHDAVVNNSIIASLTNAGVSTNHAMRVIKAYSHQIDFQRQIKKGDKISVVSENYYSSSNKLMKSGKILHASINTQGKEHEIYLYSPTGKTEDEQFFDNNGQSTKSSLLRTPVNAARISSNYGYRKHPVLGYGKMHKGVDFAASIGTPIHCAGNGVVTFIGRQNGYGRFIIVKHNSSLSTAYAHSSRFAKGLKKGSRVKQGQVIAYVGKSGRVTGPHLHFEVRINGKQVNPSKYKSTPKIKLTGSKLAKFNEFKKQLLSKVA